MIFITDIINNQGEHVTYLPRWYVGSYKYTFYDEDAKHSYTRRLDQYRAKKYIGSIGVVHPEDYYVCVNRRFLNLLDTIDYDGADDVKWTSLPRALVDQIKAIDYRISYIDNIEAFVWVTIRNYVQMLPVTITDLIARNKYIRIGNKLYFNGTDNTFYCYSIDESKVTDFTKMSTKLVLSDDFPELKSFWGS